MGCLGIVTPLVGVGIIFMGCEEMLPPREDPRTLDPSLVLEASISVDGGLVYFEERDSLSRSTAGTAWIEVRNIYSEVLSGHEGIGISARYWLEGSSHDTVEVYGDRNNLLNSFDDQGGKFMLDGDILTLLPDSTAIFLVQWDHVPYRFWDAAAPRYVRDPCAFPPCAEYVTTDPIGVFCQAEVKLFANQVTGISTASIAFAISYFFEVTSLASVTFDSTFARVDSAVHIGWYTSYQFGVHRYEVQRSAYLRGPYSTVTNGMAEPEGGGFGIESYEVVDFPGPGLWYYRVAVAEYFYPAGAFVVGNSDVVEAEFP
jgi:hypothetical protein